MGKVDNKWIKHKPNKKGFTRKPYKLLILLMSLTGFEPIPTYSQLLTRIFSCIAMHECSRLAVMSKSGKKQRMLQKKLMNNPKSKSERQNYFFSVLKH